MLNFKYPLDEDKLKNLWLRLSQSQKRKSQFILIS